VDEMKWGLADCLRRGCMRALSVLLCAYVTGRVFFTFSFFVCKHF
jgi:hypothetical protein